MEIYDYLDSIGIFTYEDVYEKVLNEWKKKDRERLCSFLFTLIKPGKPIKKTIFNFSANSTLAGFPSPCAHINCRISNLDSISRFASLYADSVFIPSPFDKYLDDTNVPKEELIFDLCSLIRLRPLIENKIIQFTSNVLCVCEDCLRSISNAENQFNEKISVIHETLENEYLQNNIYSLNFEDKRPFIEISGPEKYGFHGAMTISFRKHVPDEIKELAIKGKSVQLPGDYVLQSGLVDHLIRPILDDLYRQNPGIRLNDLTYLTHRDVDIEVLNSLHNEFDNQRSKELVDGLTHLLPILDGISLDKIVDLRMKDGDSFAVYRDALTSVLNSKDNYSAKELKELFKDKINPELTKMNQTIRRNRKHLTGSIVKDIVYASSLVSVGLYSGLLPPDVGKIMAALGGAKFVHDLYNKIGKTISSDEEIEKNSYYFLWKLQNI